MGYRYTLDLACWNCGWLNKDVYYAKSSGFTDFRCINCDTTNVIVMGFYTIPHVDDEFPSLTDEDWVEDEDFSPCC